MKTILKILAALMLLTGGYHADSLNAQEHAATDSDTADIMRIREEMLVVCDTTTNFMFSEAFDFELILYMHCLYDVALHKWLDVREEIAICLGEERGAAYREMTARVTSRLYEELKELRKIRY